MASTSGGTELSTSTSAMASPPHNNPLLSVENVTLTAHVASASARFDEARKRRVGYELSLVLSGMWPMSRVNPAVLQTTSLRRSQPAGLDRDANS